MSAYTARMDGIDLTIDSTDEESSDNDVRWENSRSGTVMNNRVVHISLCELLKCSTCAAEFASKEDLNSHMTEHSEILPFVCSSCAGHFATQVELSKHMTVHTGATYHTCDICDGKFKRISDLRKHEMIHKSVQHECSICGMVYDNESSLTAHAAMHNQTGASIRTSSIKDNDSICIDMMTPTKYIHECVVCAEGYMDKADLEIHMKELHASLGRRVFLNETDSDPSQTRQDNRHVHINGNNQMVDLTDEVEDWPIDNSRQIDAQNRSSVLVIEPCEGSSLEDNIDQKSDTSQVRYQSLLTPESNLSGLSEGNDKYPYINENSQHKAKVYHPTLLNDQVPEEHSGVTEHGTSDVIDLTDEAPIESPVQKYGSDMMDDDFMNEELSSEHESLIDVIPKDLPYKCSVCGKTLASKRSLSGHMMMHTGEIKHRCCICERGFMRESYLMKHMLLHTGVRPHKCNECGKGFINEQRLKRHMISHSEKQPFECTECGKGFAAKHKLMDHCRTHTGEKPYQCRVCGKAFGLKWSLKSHELTHTGARPYKCKICSKRFLRKGDMNKHLKLHTIYS